MSASPTFQITSGLLCLDRKTRLPLRMFGDVAEVSVGADLPPEQKQAAEAVLRNYGCARISWRDECWVKIPLRESYPETLRLPAGIRLRYRRIPSPLLDPHYPTFRRVSIIPPPAPSAERPEMQHSIAIREDSHDLVFKAGGRYRLTNAEFGVLWSMWRCMGKIVTRSSLINAMYGAFDEPENANNILSIVICRCRKKLGSHARIENCWGVGYRLIPADHPEFHDPLLKRRET